MVLHSLSPTASRCLTSVAKWFATAQVKAENPNMSRCIDEGRFGALQPLLEELGLEKRGFTLWRVSGNILIEKDDGYDNLFFPLSLDQEEIKVGNELLKPGSYVRLSNSQPLNGKLDFLIVVVPEELGKS